MLNMAENYPFDFVVSCFRISHPPGTYPIKDIMMQRITMALRRRAAVQGRDYIEVKRELLARCGTNTRISKMRAEHRAREMRVRQQMHVHEAQMRQMIMTELTSQPLADLENIVQAPTPPQFQPAHFTNATPGLEQYSVILLLLQPPFISPPPLPPPVLVSFGNTPILISQDFQCGVPASQTKLLKPPSPPPGTLDPAMLHQVAT